MANGSPHPTLGLEVLLRPEHRGPGPARDAAARLAELGFQVSGVGETSLTLALSPERFRRLFGRDPSPPPSGERFTPWIDPPPLPVPPDLAPWVESLAQARPAERFGR